MSERIRTLVVDDTVTYRRIIAEVAATFPDLEVIGSASSGDLALKKLEVTPADLVFCDVYMPGKDGVETLVEIRKLFPATVVIMISGIATRSAEITIRALELGALDFIQKPDTGSAEENFASLKAQVATAIRLVKIRLETAKVIRREAAAPPPPRPRAPEPAETTPFARVPSTFGIVAVGVSTGGPEALGKLVPALPATLPVPIVLVQHMPAGFTRSLAESLARRSNIEVVEGEEGMPLRSGVVYIAPGGRHMTVRRLNGRAEIGTNDGPPENSCRPAVDVLFRSVAGAYGDDGVLAVVLTGMGSDGEKGVRALKRRGCYCITQSEKSCVVYGMPRAVEEVGMSDKSLPIEDIPAEICARLRCCV